LLEISDGGAEMAGWSHRGRYPGAIWPRATGTTQPIASSAFESLAMWQQVLTCSP